VYTYNSTEGGDMHDQPEPTREEQEQAAESQDEHEAMRGAGHADPRPQRPSDEDRDEEIHDA
jgi:hypothetical protein